MKILENIKEDKSLRIVVSSNEETVFFLLKVYLEKDSDVEAVGVYREHYLVDKTEFFLKTKKADPLDVLKKYFKIVKKDLLSKKV